MSDSLLPHGLQHVRFPYPSVSPRICLDSCPLSRWCYPTISSSVTPLLLLPSIFPSIMDFSSDLAFSIIWPKYWSFTLSISPSNKYSQLISFRIEWFDFPGVQGTLKSLLQHQNLKASILQCSAFFMVWLSHLYMISGQTIALTIQTFVGKMTSLCFKMLSRFVTAFLPNSKSLLILWLDSPSSVILESKKIQCVIAFTFYLPRSEGTRWS